MGCIISHSNTKEKPNTVQRLERPFCFLVAKLVEGQYRVLLYDTTTEKYICVLDDAHLQLPIHVQSLGNGDWVFLQMDRFRLFQWCLKKNLEVTRKQITYAPVREPAICACHRLISIPFSNEHMLMLNRKSHIDPNNRVDVLDYDFNSEMTFFGEYAFVSKVSNNQYITLRYERYIGMSTMLHELTEFVTLTDKKITKVKTILSHNTGIHSDCCSQLVLRNGTLIQTFRNGYIMFLQCQDWSDFQLEHAPFPERLDQAFPCFAVGGRRLLDIGGFSHSKQSQETTWIYLDSPSNKQIVELDSNVVVIPTQRAVFLWFLPLTSSIKLDLTCINIFLLTGDRFMTFSDTWVATTWFVSANQQTIESQGSYQLKSYLYAVVQPSVCNDQLWLWTQIALDPFLHVRELQRIVFDFLG